MKKPSIKVESIYFHDGNSISLGENDLVVVTGPNNSGKSSFLREIYNALGHGRGINPKVVKSVNITRNFSRPELIEYLDENAFQKSGSDSYYIAGMSISRNLLPAVAGESGPGERVYELVKFFVDYIATSGRIENSNASAIFDRTQENPSSPIQYMFKDESTEAEVSAQFKIAFGKDLIVHRHALKRIPLYIGDKPKLEPGENWASTTYLSRLEKLEKLDSQGDGMRSFVTIVASLTTLDAPIVLIDEPEAFLHPPQARLLGRFVAGQRARGKQIFVATHSSDFIKGVMESRPENLKFGRLSRSADKQIFWVDPSDTELFLNDPLLRTSNALDGMLHDDVVLTEGDRDSVFYQAVLDVLTPPLPARDRMFLHTGGKHRMPHLVAALSKIGLAPIVIADIDLLRTDDVLEALIKAKGFKSENIMAKVKQIKAEIDQQSPPITGRIFKEKIQEALGEVVTESSAVPKAVTKKIEEVLKEISPWSTVKKVGKTLLRGQAARLYNEVDRDLRDKGIWLVPVGELEGFVRTGQAKGQAWLTDAISRSIASDPDLEDARRFISDVFARRGVDKSDSNEEKIP